MTREIKEARRVLAYVASGGQIQLSRVTWARITIARGIIDDLWAGRPIRPDQIQWARAVMRQTGVIDPGSTIATPDLYPPTS